MRICDWCRRTEDMVDLKEVSKYSDALICKRCDDTLNNPAKESGKEQEKK